MKTNQEWLNFEIGYACVATVLALFLFLVFMGNHFNTGLALAVGIIIPSWGHVLDAVRFSKK